MYLWLKALHIVAVIAWMAGMLYLPRLFVYHAAAEARLRAVGNLQDDGAAAAQFHHRPAMMVTWSLGMYWCCEANGFGSPAGFTPNLSRCSPMTVLHGLFARLGK